MREEIKDNVEEYSGNSPIDNIESIKTSENQLATRS